jgi:hypothetical protein
VQPSSCSLAGGAGNCCWAVFLLPNALLTTLLCFVLGADDCAGGAGDLSHTQVGVCCSSVVCLLTLAAHMCSSWPSQTWPTVFTKLTSPRSRSVHAVCWPWPVVCTEDVCCLSCVLHRLYDTRDKHLIEAYVDDVMDLVELQPNKDALVSWRLLVCFVLQPDRCV